MNFFFSFVVPYAKLWLQSQVIYWRHTFYWHTIKRSVILTFTKWPRQREVKTQFLGKNYRILIVCNQIVCILLFKRKCKSYWLGYLFIIWHKVILKFLTLKANDIMLKFLALKRQIQPVLLHNFKNKDKNLKKNCEATTLQNLYGSYKPYILLNYAMLLTF